MSKIVHKHSIFVFDDDTLEHKWKTLCEMTLTGINYVPNKPAGHDITEYEVFVNCEECIEKLNKGK